MLKKYTACLLGFFCIAMAAVGFAKAEVPDVPTQSIYVQDYAKVLSSDTKNKINTLGKQLQAKTKAQVAVVTVNSLDGTPIEEYSLELLRKWGIGDKTLNNGVVMVIAVEDKQSRIEVGYGLEGALPDGKTGQIQDEYMLPYFKQSDYNSGILNGYLALNQVVADEYKVALEGAATPTKAPVRQSSIWDDMMNFVIVIGIIILVILDFMFFGGRITMLVLSLVGRRGGGSGGGGFGGGSGGGGGSSRRW